MAIDTNRLAGTAYVTVDGKTYMLVGDLKYQVSGYKRETLTGMDGVHGYSEAPVAGFISGTFRDGSGISLADINAATNVTIVAELANGKTIVARNAWTTDIQEVDTAEAKFECRWDSRSVSEQ